MYRRMKEDWTLAVVRTDNFWFHYFCKHLDISMMRVKNRGAECQGKIIMRSITN